MKKDRKFRKAVNDNPLFKEERKSGLKLNIVIGLWVIDKLVMFLLFIFASDIGRIRTFVHDFLINLF